MALEEENTADMVLFDVEDEWKEAIKNLIEEKKTLDENKIKIAEYKLEQSRLRVQELRDKAIEKEKIAEKIVSQRRKTSRQKIPPPSKTIPSSSHQPDCSLKVLTWNVSWEAMDLRGIKGSAQKYRENCKKISSSSSDNLCRNNLIRVCVDGKFDIIGLQEADKNLAKNIIDKDPSRSSKDYELGKQTAIIIYNKEKLTLKYYNENTVKRVKKDGRMDTRPVISCLFEIKKNNKFIVVISMHACHYMEMEYFKKK